MPNVNWFWFIVGILFGKFALDMIVMIVMGLFARVSGRSVASPVGL